MKHNKSMASNTSPSSFDEADESLTKIPGNRPKITRTIREEDIKKLISLVKRHPCIWKVGSQAYTNKLARQNAWDTIYKKFGGQYSESDLRAKWANLRIQYRINTNKHKNKTGRVWRYFASLDFIAEGSKYRSYSQADYIPEDKFDSNEDHEHVSNGYYENEPEALGTDENPLVDITNDAVQPNGNYSVVSDVNMAFCNYICKELALMQESKAIQMRKKIMELLITIGINHNKV